MAIRTETTGASECRPRARERERERLFGMRGMRREKATEQKIAAFMTKLYSMNSDSELYTSTADAPVFYLEKC